MQNLSLFCFPSAQNFDRLVWNRIATGALLLALPTAFGRGNFYRLLLAAAGGQRPRLLRAFDSALLARHFVGANGAHSRASGDHFDSSWIVKPFVCARHRRFPIARSRSALAAAILDSGPVGLASCSGPGSDLLVGCSGWWNGPALANDPLPAFRSGYFDADRWAGGDEPRSRPAVRFRGYGQCSPRHLRLGRSTHRLLLLRFKSRILFQLNTTSLV